MKESDELLIDKLIEKFHELGFSKRYKPNGRFEKLHIVHYKDDDELEHFYDGLLLENLYINSKGGHYPTINGINATVPKRKEHNTYDYIAADTHHHKYSGLKIPICFTGKILLENGSISKYCINMGYQQYWVYKELKEFVFNSGKLVEINDYSQMAETARNKSDDLRKHLCDPEKFVEDSFFLDYDVKAWWIKR